jgi:hypothetical protein
VLAALEPIEAAAASVAPDAQQPSTDDQAALLAIAGGAKRPSGDAVNEAGVGEKVLRRRARQRYGQRISQAGRPHLAGNRPNISECRHSSAISDTARPAAAVAASGASRNRCRIASGAV